MCARARKPCSAAPSCFHVHTPAGPTRTPGCNGDLRGGNPARERLIRSDATSLHGERPGKEGRKGVTCNREPPLGALDV
eukprot:4379739-Prymnesium_polylepis.1